MSRKPIINQIDGDFILALSNIKTWQCSSLPTDIDITPAQLQMMHYRQLLWPLVSQNCDIQLDFEQLWKKLQIIYTKPFSSELLHWAQQSMVRLGNRGACISCLNDLTEMWMEQVQDLRVSCVDDTLQLIYHTQSELTVSSDRLVPLGTK